jgi:TPR repeat protein
MRRSVWHVTFGVLLIAILVGGAAAQSPQHTSRSAEIVFWESVRNSNDPAEIEAYLKAYPNGQFAPLARIRLNKLKGAAADKPATPPPAPAASAAPTTPPQAKIEIPPAPTAKVRGWIGAQIRDLTAARAQELGLDKARGAEIIAVVPFGPSARSGLKVGDIALSVGTTGIIDMRHMVRLTSGLRPGQSSELLVLRGGKRQTLTLTIGNYFEDHWNAAHGGDPAAMTGLGLIYSGGLLVTRDLREAARWYRRAADNGDLAGMRLLGESYQFGRGVNQNDDEAVRWFRKAARDGQGDAGAMFDLGLMHTKGQGVKRDLAEAALWYKRAAEKGDIRAANNYGAALDSGNGVEKNQKLAVAQFRIAARGGNIQGLVNLGLAYFSGSGVAKNLSEALRLFRIGAERGEGTSIYQIGYYYENGLAGLNKDRAEAIRYYRKAAEKNSPDARNRLKRLGVSLYDPIELQRLLADLDYDPGRVDGRLRSKTRQAIRAFQKDKGYKVNGKASLQLIGQLRAEKRAREMAKQAKTPPAVGTTPVPQVDSKPVQKPDFDKLKQLDSPQ